MFSKGRNTFISSGLMLTSNLVCWILIGAFITGCGDGEDKKAAAQVQVSRTEKPVVFVSIPPQRTFVREIAGDRPEIHVMVKPGHSPATYEPTPKQMIALATAHLYLRTGVPFESAWMDRIRAANPRMLVINTAQDIKRRAMERHYHQASGRQHAEGHDKMHSSDSHKDPHVWLAPDLVKKQADTICHALQKIDPYNTHKYETNLVAFQQRLDDLDNYIRQKLQGLENRTFMVFHPSWGYFADSYNLEQFAVEIEGKEPGGKALATIIDRARKLNIDTIYVQPQFSQASAKTIAQAIDAEIVVLDPLSDDYFTNLRRAADMLAAKDE